MEDNGYKDIHKLTQFVTTLNSRRKYSLDLTPKNVNNSSILSILCSKPLRGFGKPKSENGDRVRFSKYGSSFWRGYKPQFTQKVFEIVAFSSRKPTTYPIKDEQDEIIRGKNYQKELIKVT